jgi:hypothetical protein
VQHGVWLNRRDLILDLTRQCGQIAFRAHAYNKTVLGTDLRSVAAGREDYGRFAPNRIADHVLPGSTTPTIVFAGGTPGRKLLILHLDKILSTDRGAPDFYPIDTLRSPDIGIARFPSS